MSANLEFLEAEFLKLQKPDRERLLERLVISLESDPTVDAAWEAEADRRVAAFESGAVGLVSADDALLRWQARLKA